MRRSSTSRWRARLKPRGAFMGNFLDLAKAWGGYNPRANQPLTIYPALPKARKEWRCQRAGLRCA